MRIISYADLTWPEVAELPRTLPMLIPLGLGTYDLHALAGLPHPQALCLLPAMPYGFARTDSNPLAALTVPSTLWRRVLRGIAGELLSQGFRQIWLLTPAGMADPVRPTGWPVVTAPFEPAPCSPWPADLTRRVVVISTGHTEQHGHHLPLSTDTVIVQAIADGLARRAPAEVCCLPAWPYGVSTHTRQFPGTLNLGGRVFEDFLLAVTTRLAALGAETLYFSNGHGGNHSFLVNVVKLAGEAHPLRFIATEWLHTTGPALGRYRETAIGGMGHGGELETSYMLHLRPDLVHMARATTETDFISTPEYFMDWIESGSLIANPPWSDDTISGIYGDGRLGTAAKGRLWLEAAVEEKLDRVREIREQHTLRHLHRTWRSESGRVQDQARHSATSHHFPPFPLNP
ncbi:MAG: creatininase family protein [Caldilineales bacterium]